MNNAPAEGDNLHAFPDEQVTSSADLAFDGLDDLVAQIKETADKLLRDRASRADVKLVATALKELRYSFKVFSSLKNRRKVTVFGSARTPPSDPSFQQAAAFGKAVADAGFMVITGAASGIMEAGHVGAGRQNSIGVNILLPFEQSANSVITGDDKLMHLKYFFTRKLLFVKESDAVALFPGGFGTHDEAFEALTLVQTGKSHIFPIVCVAPPGDDYWHAWDQFIRSNLLDRKLISPADMALYNVTDSVDQAVAEITNFYRVYHSLRYIKGDLVLRLQKAPSGATLERICSEFRDIVVDGTFVVTEADRAEVNETRIAELPRLRFRFDRRNLGRLRQLIDLINAEVH
ncbi:MAG: LOG family protein [Gemmataceae bacterium]